MFWRRQEKKWRTTAGTAASQGNDGGEKEECDATTATRTRAEVGRR